MSSRVNRVLDLIVMVAEVNQLHLYLLSDKNEEPRGDMAPLSLSLLFSKCLE